MKGSLNSLIRCLGVAWFSAMTLYIVWLPLDPVIPAPEPRDSTVGMTCLSVKKKRTCVEPNVSPGPNSTEIWSSFIGVGPVLSGITSVMQMLKHHPQIQVGDRHRFTRAVDSSYKVADCCTESELNFFFDENLLLRGLDYYKSFFGPRRLEARVAGEASPTYSDHPLVPYRIHGVLGPEVKLLFTIRDPVDALLSLYTLRQQDERIPIPVYFRRMLSDQKVYEDCIEKTITSVFRDTKSTSPSLFYDVLTHRDLKIAEKMLLDEAGMMCWNKQTSIRHHHERLQQFLYKDNLLRWNTVFPNQVYCIWSDEFRVKGLEIGNSILEFLGVNKMDSLPANFSPLSYESSMERRKQDFLKDLSFQYQEMCDYLKERNKGLEKLCPRKWLGKWEWCKDMK